MKRNYNSLVVCRITFNFQIFESNANSVLQYRAAAINYSASPRASKIAL